MHLTVLNSSSAQEVLTVILSCSNTALAGEVYGQCVDFNHHVQSIHITIDSGCLLHK